jgi:hypothetical protein
VAEAGDDHFHRTGSPSTSVATTTSTGPKRLTREAPIPALNSRRPPTLDARPELESLVQPAAYQGKGQLG